MPDRPRFGLPALVRPEWAALLGGLGCVVVSGLGEATYAFVSGPLIATLVGGGAVPSSLMPSALPWLERMPGSPLLALALFLVAVALVKGLAHLGQTALLAGAALRVGRRLRTRVFSSLIHAPLALHRDRGPGKYLTRLLDDVTRAQQALVDAPIAILREGFSALLLLGVACWMAPRLAIVSVFLLPVVGWAVGMLSRRVRRAAAKGQGALDGVSQRAIGALSGIREVKLWGMEQQEVSRFDEHAERYARWRLRAHVLRALSPLFNELAAAVALGGVLLYGAAMVAAGTIAVERLLSFIAAALMLYRPLKRVGDGVQSMAAGRASIDRVGEVLSGTKEEPGLRPGACSLASSVVLDGLTVHLGGIEVVRSVSLTLEPGSLVMLRGANGSGKTTFADALCGLLPFDGTVRWDGESVAGTSLRSRTALVSQYPFIFDGSVEDNLRVAAPKATGGQLQAALADVGLWDRFSRSGSLCTVLGTGGLTLSGGERQRLALARALLRDARLLVFDEPTAGLDEEGVRLFWLLVERLRSGRAILLIGHNLAPAMPNSRHLVMASGRVSALPPRDAQFGSPSQQPTIQAAEATNPQPNGIPSS